MKKKKNYNGRMSERWVKDLLPLGTNEDKLFLEDAPWIIVAFKKVYETVKDWERCNNYYVNEIDRDCLRSFNRCNSYCWFGNLYPHAQPNEFPEQDP